MSERYSREDHEAYRREVEAQQRREAQERHERQAKDAARLKWIADGGSESAFERSWSEIRDEMRRRRVVADDERARQNMRASGVSRI
jgi:hypothetical protein